MLKFTLVDQYSVDEEVVPRFLKWAESKELEIDFDNFFQFLLEEDNIDDWWSYMKDCVCESNFEEFINDGKRIS